MNYNNTNQEGEYNSHDYQPRPVFVPPQESPQEQPQSQSSYTYATDYSYPQQNPPQLPLYIIFLFMQHNRLLIPKKQQNC